MELRYVTEARSELDDAIAWYETKQPGLGQRFKTVCDHAEASILSRPFAWPEISPGSRRYITDLFPYEVIYIVEGEQITIIAIAHTKRRPGYWRARLKH